MVALLAEGVDRNPSEDFHLNAVCVALLAEGVDRNLLYHKKEGLSSRRPPRGGRG